MHALYPSLLLECGLLVGGLLSIILVVTCTLLLQLGQGLGHQIIWHDPHVTGDVPSCVRVPSTPEKLWSQRWCDWDKPLISMTE